MGERAGRMSMRHVLVIIAGVLILLGPCALVYNTWSIFVVPVSTSLECSSSQFTFYVTVVYLVGALAAPLAGNVLERFDVRAVLSVSVVVTAFGIALCSLWSEVWQFYISGVIEGLGIVSLMFLAVPTLINRWFSVRTGFFIGLCMAMSGVGGAMWSMVGGALIAAYDWRVAYGVLSVIGVVLALPATLLFIRSYPHQIGLQPFGAEEVHYAGEGDYLHENERSQDERDLRVWGVSAGVMFRSPVFYVLMITVGLFNALTPVGNLFASYIYYLGSIGAAGITPTSAIMIASTVAACLMVTAAIAKVSLGALSDKSVVAALVVACGAGAVSIVCMILGASWVGALYVGAVLFGFLYAAVDALGPAMTLKLVGPRDYTLIYSRIAVFVNVAGAVAVVAFTALSELGWTVEWIVSLVGIAITLVLGLLVVRLGSRLEQTYEEKEVR